MGCIHLALDRGQRLTCEYGNEPSGSIKCEEFLDYMSNCYLVKKDCFMELSNVI
jgi:hypothetical protein